MLSIVLTQDLINIFTPSSLCVQFLVEELTRIITGIQTPEKTKQIMREEWREVERKGRYREKEGGMKVVGRKGRWGKRKGREEGGRR